VLPRRISFTLFLDSATVGFLRDPPAGCVEAYPATSPAAFPFVNFPGQSLLLGVKQLLIKGNQHRTVPIEDLLSVR